MSALEALEARGAKTVVVACSVFLGLCLLASSVICWWQAERVRELGIEAFRVQCGYTGPGPLLPNGSFNLSYYASTQGVTCYRAASPT